MVHMFHSSTHFGCKSTVRNSMVILLFLLLPFSPKALTMLFGTALASPLMFCCVAWKSLNFALFISKETVCVFLMMVVAVFNVHFILLKRKWTQNELKSDKFRSVVYALILLQSNMIYGINSFQPGRSFDFSAKELITQKWTRQWTHHITNRRATTHKG